MKTKLSICLFLAAASLMLLLIACAKDKEDEKKTEHNVPGDFLTIPDAINAATDGDIIYVSPGVYVGNINFAGKNIIIQTNGTGSTKSDEATIIQGDGNGPVIRFDNGESDQAVLSGFTITGGAAGNNNDGGGIVITNSSSPIIKNCTIIGNSARYGGGVLVSNQSSPKFENNVFAENTALSGRGAGIYVISQSSVNLTGNTFRDHEDVDGVIRIGGNNASQNASAVISGNIIDNNIASFGTGGIFVTLESEAVITGNQITNNHGVGDNSGGAITVSFSSIAEISNNIITGNTATRAGAVIIYRESEANISNNTISENTAGIEEGYGLGGGIMLTYFGKATITNNTITNNKAMSHTHGGGGIAIYSWGQETQATITDNEIKNNEAFRRGGGIYVAGTGTSVVISNNEISENHAKTHNQACGGGIYLGSILEAAIYANTISGNWAQWYGGGIYAHRSAVVKDTAGEQWPRANFPPADEPNNTYNLNDHGDDTHMGAHVFFDN
jgi:parallel beta-helix repeat protein